MTKLSNRGKRLKIAGFVLLAVGSVFFAPGQLMPHENRSFVIDEMYLAAFPLLIIGALLSWRGRQYLAKDAAPGILKDSRPDVLYLRAFRADTRLWVPLLSSLSATALVSTSATQEEQLAEALQPFGDMVAIGRPAEKLPTPGASRLCASEDDWKSTVVELMQSARLVVIRAAQTRGLLWELKEAAQFVAPQNLLVLVFRMRKKHYDAFRLDADQILNSSLPRANQISRFGRVSGFVRFSSSWTPEFFPLRIPILRRIGPRPLSRLLIYTLKPVFEEHGLAWKVPQVSLLGWFFVIAIVLFGFAFLYRSIMSV